MSFNVIPVHSPGGFSLDFEPKIFRTTRSITMEFGPIITNSLEHVTPQVFHSSVLYTCGTVGLGTKFVPFSHRQHVKPVVVTYSLKLLNRF